MQYFERGRPPEHEDLVTTSVKIEAQLLREAKNMNINLSEVLRNALSMAINLPEYQERAKIDKRLEKVSILMRKKIKKRIQEDQNTGIRWADWLKTKHKIEITADELKTWAGY